jgi:hypothetical protein
MTMAEEAGTRTCPADGCGAEISGAMLMCVKDWLRVPRPLRVAVWSAWRNGKGAGSMAHAMAAGAAIAAVNRK